ncbi:hypothetical protein [Vibrio casei]|uniref:hypothetical protein n=1 Tax=Vibrio casei TaxID=673372 RepID=UPI003F9CAFD2
MLNLNHYLDEFNATFLVKKPSSDPVKLINDELEEMLNEKEYTANHLKEAIDIIYITANQMRAMGYDIDEHVKIALADKCDGTTMIISAMVHGLRTYLSAQKMADVIASTIEYCERLGYDWESAFLEVHRSNTSKVVSRKDAIGELSIAKDRYPNAHIVELQQYFLLKCGDTGKIIKPTCYSAAVIQVEWYQS